MIRHSLPEYRWKQGAAWSNDTGVIFGTSGTTWESR